MSNRNKRNSLMNRSVFVSFLVAVFVLVGLASPAIAQASSDAVLIMHFDEGSGTVAKDESDHGNDGTIYGATWTTGVSGKALQFDGVDDYVQFNSPITNNAPFSIESWVKSASPNPSTHQGIIANGGETRASYGFILSTDTRCNGWYFGARAAHNEYDGYATVSPISVEWTHLVGVWDGTSNANSIKLYVNGKLAGSSSATPGSQRAGTANNLVIGTISEIPRKYYFAGIIDEVAIYNRALSPEEIKAHYNAKRAGGSTEESTSELINSVSTRIDALKRSNVDTSLIEQALSNAQSSYDLGNHDEAYEVAQSALKMADDAYESQQDIESAQSEIDDAKSIGTEVKEAEAKLKEAKDALNKGNYEYAQDWADDASELSKHASIGSVQIKDLKALATKYDQRTVVISGTIRDIETVYGEGYTFALDDSSGMISVAYQGSLGDIKDGDKVTASGIFEASTGTLVADTVQKSGVGGGGVPGFEVIFAIAGLLIAVYFLKRK